MSDEDDGSDCGPSLPAGVLRSRGGWAGDSLEIDHQREALQQSESGNNKADHAAVDLSQFRNEEVGKGYQAKHVIRQAGAPSKVSGIVNMSKKDISSKKDESKPKPNDTTTKETYLACRGMRNFIREVDKILEKS
ncbi:hypothetical protein QTG54_011884 [Skeletonema marinoi]|uniref:Uncharacterized protein n=1 Tax=Skeletonema marinoi TaxID=267567 RepID=A0AAD8Y1R0_9STRA|nr:hypothetical protein QTG54_011884 [Skeletonema marinoi]